MRFFIPVIITLIFSSILVGYGFFLIKTADNLPMPDWLLYTALSIIGTILLIMPVILIQRIKELINEEKDDISKY